MIENAIGIMPIPLGVAVNFCINGKDYLIPMATEEPSVIAAASNMARICRADGGFRTSNTGAVMIAQIPGCLCERRIRGETEDFGKERSLNQGGQRERSASRSDGWWHEGSGCENCRIGTWEDGDYTYPGGHKRCHGEPIPSIRWQKHWRL